MPRPCESGLRQELITAAARIVAERGAIAIAKDDGEPDTWVYFDDFDRAVAWFYGVSPVVVEALRQGIDLEVHHDAPENSDPQDTEAPVPSDDPAEGEELRKDM